MASPHTLRPGTRRLVWALRLICFVALTLLIVLITLVILVPAALSGDEVPNPVTALPPGALRGLGIAYAVLMLLPALWGVLTLMRLTGAYLRDEVFTPRAARHLKTIGWVMMVSAGLKFVSGPFYGALTLLGTVETGERSAIALAFGAGDLALIGGGFLFITLGRVMLDASQIASENQEFI